MAFDASGTFTRYGGATIWQGDATAGTKILADRHDDHDQELANGLSECITRTGKGAPTADIPWGGKRLVNLAAPINPNDAVTKAYADAIRTYATGLTISGADLNGRLTFSSPSGANGIAWTGADLSWLARLSPNRLVLNDKADGTGADKVVVGEDGTINTTGAIATAGNLTVSGGIIVGGTSLTVATSAAGGAIALRPNGSGNVAGQVTLSTTGLVNTNGNINVNGAAGAGVVGTTLAPGNLATSTSTTATYNHHLFYNPNGIVGAIATSGAATIYATSSSADLKDVGADYDPAEAVAIIRADPVKSFTWKATGDDAIGWIAQQSHAVREDLAVHVPATEADEKGEGATEEWWGIDYSQRTPYLWAALANALDRIEALEARLAALEAA